MFKVTVTECNPMADLGAPPVEVEVFRQSVETLELRKVIEAVNFKPRKPRAANAPKKEKP
jgi:hypothetical protein